jgi:hypothetical protein
MKTPPPAPPRASFASSPSSSRAPRAREKAPRGAEPPVPFHAFIAYADVPAAGRAMGTINEVLAALRRKHALKPMLWRFDQLVNSKWREAAIADATTANVVVLASTSAKTLTTELESWIGHFLASKRGTRTTLIALFGTEDAWTISIEESDPALEQRLVA